MTKTRILPTVGKQYISRHDGAVVKVVKVRRGSFDTMVEFVKVNNPKYQYYLDSFWAHYKVMEEEDAK